MIRNCFAPLCSADWEMFKQCCRNQKGWWAPAPHHFFADQLTISQPVGAHYAHHILHAPSDFQTFLRPYFSNFWQFASVFLYHVSLRSSIQRHMIQNHVRKIVWQCMDFIKISLGTNFRLNRFWICIDLHFKLIYNLVYSLEFDLRICSGQVWFIC